MNALKAYDEETVNGETLFVNRQHAGDTSPVDQLIAIAPEDEEDDDEDDEDEDGYGGDNEAIEGPRKRALAPSHSATHALR